MNAQEARKFIEGLFNEVWIPCDISLMDKYYHKAVKAYVGENVLDYDGLIQRISYNKKNLENYTVRIVDLFISENKIAARMNQHAFDSSKDESMNFHVIVIYELKAGKIINLWAELTGNLDLKNSNK